jgi:hypothetical protein
MTIRRLLASLLAFSVCTMCPLLGQAPASKKKPADEQVVPPALVAVTLRSDGKTYVTIPNKLAPSKFKSKTIMLAPGSYTAKGGRSGYKAETVDFIVVPNMNPNTVTVICTTK